MCQEGGEFLRRSVSELPRREKKRAAAVMRPAADRMRQPTGGQGGMLWGGGSKGEACACVRVCAGKRERESEREIRAARERSKFQADAADRAAGDGMLMMMPIKHGRQQQH